MTNTTFKFDPSELPEVVKTDSYQTNPGGTTYTIYKAGDWSFELPDDGNPEDARQAALAWIAWREHLIKTA